MTDMELLEEAAFELRNYEFTEHAAAVVRASERLAGVQWALEAYGDLSLGALKWRIGQILSGE